MRWARYLGFALVAYGAALFAYAVATGQGGAGIFVVFPFVYGTGTFALLGVLLAFAGMMVIFFSWSGREFDGADGARTGPSSSGQSRSGGFILIGPIPIVWGSDRGMFWASLAVVLAMLAVLAFLLM